MPSNGTKRLLPCSELVEPTQKTYCARKVTGLLTSDPQSE
jgi:hypothetical protein